MSVNKRWLRDQAAILEHLEEELQGLVAEASARSRVPRGDRDRSVSVAVALLS